MDIVTFLEERLKDDALAIARTVDPRDERAMTELRAKRQILDWHRGWPVLVTGPMEVQTSQRGHLDINAYALRVSQRMAWLTTREYVRRFGEQPPTTPVLRALAAIYADHPDYDPDWAPLPTD